MSATLHIGLIINPLAGLGGSLAMKGSDGEAARAVAASAGTGRAKDRALRALAALAAHRDSFAITCWGRDMGAAAAAEAGLDASVAGDYEAPLPGPGDTRRAALALRARGVDLIVFVGGDGTARDIYDAVGDSFPVLGIPAGVKMQSGVFAVSPEAAGALLVQLAAGGLVAVQLREVRDIDEQALREGRVNSRFHGELLVPSEGRFLQHTKVGGREDPGLVAADIAAWMAETQEAGRTYLLGPGTTTAAIAAELGVQSTLLGVDAVRDGSRVAADATEADLLAVVEDAPGPVSIVVTATGAQGYLFGRGNQQFSPAVIRAVGVDNVLVVATKSKISALDGRPLLVDTNDPALDAALSGYREVITGYDDRLLYRVSSGWDDA